MPVVFEFESLQIVHGLFSTQIKNTISGRSRKLKGWEIDSWMIFNNTLERAKIPVCYKVKNQNELPEQVFAAYKQFCISLDPDARIEKYYAWNHLMTGNDYDVHFFVQDVICGVKGLLRFEPKPLSEMQRVLSGTIRNTDKDLVFKNDYDAFIYACEFIANDYLRGPCVGVVIQRKTDGDYVVKIANFRDKSIPRELDKKEVGENYDLYCVAATPVTINPMNFKNGDLVEVEVVRSARENRLGPIAGTFHKIKPIFNTERGWVDDYGN